MAKKEMYASKKAMTKHEKAEPAKMRAMEKKMGIVDVVASKSKKKSSMLKKKGK